MKRDVTQYDFTEAFKDMGRGDSFSYEGLKALYDHLEDLYDGAGSEEYELDVIALDCEYCEYFSALEAAQEYGHEPDEDHDEDEREEAAAEWLNEQTSVIAFNGGVIIQGF